MFDEALVERLTAFAGARGFIAHWPHLNRLGETPLPVSPEKEYRYIYPLDIEAVLAELSKTHAVVPLEEYNVLCGLPSKVRGLLADLAHTLAEEHERYAEKLALQARRIFEDYVAKEASPDVRPSTR